MLKDFRRLEIIHKDTGYILYRGEKPGSRQHMLMRTSAAEHPGETEIQRFQHEFELARNMPTPSLLQPIGFEWLDDKPCVFFDDFAGRPLLDLMDQPLDIASFLALAVNASQALSKVHQRGLILRNLNPGNILVHPRSFEIKFSDIGSARFHTSGQGCRPAASGFEGHLAYLAPEQLGQMMSCADARTDLYALGIIYYQMLTGTLPFSAEDPLEWAHCHIARPVLAPHSVCPTVPEALSKVILKLVAKSPDDRYQSASGVATDLEQCQVEWQHHQRIQPFPLARLDINNRLQIPSKLYGRESEIAQLFAGFQRVTETGVTEWISVSGYSGIGKSSMVNELSRAQSGLKGFFVTGKFDQYKRNIPYMTIATAFQNLLNQILIESDEQLGVWRQHLLQALGNNAQIMIDLVPELELIIGPQEPVTPSPPAEARTRFYMVCRQFLQVFADKGRPVVLFLDDMQWADLASLALCQHFMTHEESRNLLLIGAYRSNEVDANHPLALTLNELRQTQAKLVEIHLGVLSLDNVGQFIAGILRCDTEQAAPLANLVYEKTNGNPFYTIQFLQTLVTENLLTVNYHSARWEWNLEQIHRQGYTDNVIDFMVKKIRRLSEDSQLLIQLAAFIGSKFSLESLKLVSRRGREELMGGLWPVLQHGFVLEDSDGDYRFIHDRVQQAAYFLLTKDEREQRHLQIGRLLLANCPDAKVSGQLFEIVNHLNRAAHLTEDHEEKDHLVSLNLAAGQQAKAATAYSVALQYFRAGIDLLPERGGWQRYDVCFPLNLQAAECAFLGGQIEQAESFIGDLMEHARNSLDQAKVCRVRMGLHVTKGELAEGVEAAIAGLDVLGVTGLSPHPGYEQVMAEHRKVDNQLKQISVRDLLEKKTMTDPSIQAAMDLLVALAALAFFSDGNLFILHILYSVKLSLTYGNHGGTTAGLAWYGLWIGAGFNRYVEGYEYAKAAKLLAEQEVYRSYMNRVDFLLELTAVWVAPMDEALIHIEASFKESVESGDHVFASFCCNHIVIDRLFRGDHLDDVFAEAERRLEFVRKVPYQDIIELIGDMKQFIKTMQGRTESLSTFDDEHYNECDYETQLTPDRMATLVCWHYILKLMARYLSGDHKEALQAANEAKQRLWSSIGHVQVCDYTFFSALNLAALYDSASAQEKAEYRQGIDALYQQLAIWETTQPTSFQDKAKLVAAEIARLDGQVEDALRLYEEAIGAAKNNGFIHIEAMAYEAAGRFLLSRGLKRLATGNFQQACRAYGLWGAAGKVNQLRLLYLEQAGEAVSEGDIAQKLSASYRFDVTAVLRATQAISSEIKQAGLLDRLMTTVLELGGADSGQLVMMMGSGDLQQAAAAEAREHGVELTLAEERLQVKAIPRSIVSYVKRTGKKLILDQMRLGLEFADDPYFVSHRPKSVLCLPIYRQDRLIGFLYLENSKVNAAFDENRLAVLDILAAQAAISLENADLFQKRLVAEESLRRNEEKLNAVLQHMVEGVVASDAEGHVILANEPCKEILGVSAIEEGALSLDSYQNLFEIRDKDGKIIETKDLPLAKSLQGEVIIKEMLVLRKYDTDRVLFLEVSAAPIKDNSQDIVGGVLVMRDITDIVGFEKVKEDFLRVVAHELKTPLAIIKGYSQLILKDKSNCPTIAQKSVDRIILGTDRLSALVDDLMDVSMLQMDKLILQPVELDLSKLVTDATNDLADITPSVQFEFDIEPGLYVNGHKSRLIQVMNNLLNNAVKYSPEGGVIWVRAHQDNNQHALVSIKDQGIGIPKNMESRIFQAFYRAHSGGEHDYGGMGVGLFISRSIIMRHSGSIYFHSEEGKGTEMSFHLPLVRLGDDRNAKSDSGRRG